MRTAVFQSDRSRSVGGLPDAATLLDRFAHLDVLDRIDGRRQRVLVEDDEIGEHARLDAALAVFLADLPGGAGGECLLRGIVLEAFARAAAAPGRRPAPPRGTTPDKRTP